jgi:hypothetical protein
MKGTQLWQGIGSPLIEGRSRQLPPFWRPWLGAALIGAVAASAGAWFFYGVWPYDLFVGASAVGAALGVALARRLEWRRSWPLGVAVAILLALVYFAAVMHFWPESLVAVWSRRVL